MMIGPNSFIWRNPHNFHISCDRLEFITDPFIRGPMKAKQPKQPKQPWPGVLWVRCRPDPPVLDRMGLDRDGYSGVLIRIADLVLLKAWMGEASSDGPGWRREGEELSRTTPPPTPPHHYKYLGYLSLRFLVCRWFICVPTVSLFVTHISAYLVACPHARAGMTHPKSYKAARHLGFLFTCGSVVVRIVDC